MLREAKRLIYVILLFILSLRGLKIKYDTKYHLLLNILKIDI